MALLSVGTIAANAATFTTDFSSDPGGTPVGIAEVEDGVLKLTDLADLPPADPPKPLPQNGSYILPDFNDGAPIQAFTARFKAAVGGGTSLGAQGFSFVLADDLSFDTPFREGGATGDGTGVSTGLIISFDTIDNLPGFNANGNDPGDAPGIIVKIGGAKVTARRFTGIQTYPANSTETRFAEVEIRLDPDGTLDVTYDGTKVYDNVGIGYTPIAGVFGFGAGTGELTAAIRNNHWIDDLTIETTPVGDGPYVSSKAPASQQARPDAVVTVVIENLASANVQMTFDGAAVTPTVQSQGNTQTVTYDPPGLLASGSSHQVEVTYGDNQKFAFEFTVAEYVTIPASAKAPAGVVNTGSSGFKARVYQVTGPAPNSVTAAERQLAGEMGENVAYLEEADADGTFTLETINWDDDQIGAGQFPEDNPIPGYPGYHPDGFEVYDNIVIESTAYLELPAGLVTLGVTSDDGFKVTIGSDPRDATAPVIGVFNGVSTSTFSFVVEEAGLYGVRLLWYEAGGDAHCEFYSFNSAGERILINDRSTPGHIKAYSNRSGAAPPYISKASPGPGDTGVNPRLNVEIVITEDTTAVNPDSIQLKIADTTVVPTVAKNGKQTTVSYAHAGSVPEGTYTVDFSFADGSGNAISSSWSFSTSPGACESVSGPAVSAYWKFNGSLDAEVGSAARFMDPAIADHYSFGTSGQGDFADIPGIDGQPVSFLAIPRNENGEDFRRTGLRMDTNLGPSGGGNNANTWTLIMDLYWGDGHGFGSVLRTHDLDQVSDADLFWRASDGTYGKGCCSIYDGIDPEHSHQRHAWARIVIVTDLTANPPRMAKFVNGVKHREDLVGDGGILDGRYSLPPEIIMFNDGDDNEQSTVYVSAVQLRNGALTDQEVAELGGPSADGIPVPAGGGGGSTVTAQWEFDGNLEASVGTDAVFIDPSIADHYSFGTTGEGDFADIPHINGQPARFLSIPRNENGDDFRRTGLRVRPGIPANGGGNNANVWTLILDLYWGDGPTAGTVLRTHDLDQPNDGDLFWRDDGSYGKGCCSNYDGVDPNNSHQRHTWARVVFVADLTANPPRLAKFINGVKHREDLSGDGGILDGRYSLPAEIYMFNDGDDNEQSSLLVSSVQFRSVAMTDAEVAALGGPSADGIPLPQGGGGDTCLPLGGGSSTEVELYSSATVEGPYTPEANATVNTGARTVTIPVPAATRFYRIRAGSAVTISDIAVQGANLVLTYQ